MFDWIHIAASWAVNNGLSRCGFALMRATPLDKDVVKQLFYRLVSVGF
jgi:hypothetical protein